MDQYGRYRIFHRNFFERVRSGNPMTSLISPSSPTGSLRVRSHAKINWTLDVLFRRTDGFHEIRTIYQTVSLHDTVILSDIPKGIEVSCDKPEVPCDATNLVHQAADLLKQASGVGKGVRIRIEKRIPVAAGLGGGSSNAAATLLGLVKLWGLKVSETDLFQISAAIGSDVPFFLIGGTCLGVGRGEEVYGITGIECSNLLLVNPGFGVATAGAYQRLERLTSVESPRMIPFTLLAANGVEALPLAARNDLESAVLVDHPEIDRIKLRLISLGAKHALMSGSGSTVFGVFDNLPACEQAAVNIRASGLWVERVCTISRQDYRNGMFD